MFMSRRDLVLSVDEQELSCSMFMMTKLLCLMFVAKKFEDD